MANWYRCSLYTRNVTMTSHYKLKNRSAVKIKLRNHSNITDLHVSTDHPLPHFGGVCGVCVCVCGGGGCHYVGLKLVQFDTEVQVFAFCRNYFDSYSQRPRGHVLPPFGLEGNSRLVGFLKMY